ncbi:carbamoyl-phosphate synthase L chain, ATP binding domain protein, partial [Vibrio parahaemolyticus V-223/04]
KLTKF